MAKKAAKTPERTSGAPAYNPFLKPEHIGKGKSRLALTGWTRRMTGRYGEQIIVEVTDEKEKSFDFAIGVGSPNHRILFKTMGQRESAWKGTITVEVQRGQNAPFIAILETDSTDAPF